MKQNALIAVGYALITHSAPFKVVRAEIPEDESIPGQGEKVDITYTTEEGQEVSEEGLVSEVFEVERSFVDFVFRRPLKRYAVVVICGKMEQVAFDAVVTVQT